MFENPDGVRPTERWFHAAGCRRWLTVRRDTSVDVGPRDQLTGIAGGAVDRAPPARRRPVRGRGDGPAAGDDRGRRSGGRPRRSGPRVHRHRRGRVDVRASSIGSRAVLETAGIRGRACSTGSSRTRARRRSSGAARRSTAFGLDATRSSSPSAAARRWTRPRSSRCTRRTAATSSGLGYHRADLRPGRPLVAVPTTAGTGAETNTYGVITDEVAGRKVYIGHRRVCPVGTDPRPGADRRAASRRRPPRPASTR